MYACTVCIHCSIYFYICRSQNDTSGHEYALPSGRVEEVSEGKKKYTFNLLCKGVPEMQFSLDEEDSYHAWVNKLQAACSSGTFETCTVSYLYIPWVYFL